MDTIEEKAYLAMNMTSKVSEHDNYHRHRTPFLHHDESLTEEEIFLVKEYEHEFSIILSFYLLTKDDDKMNINYIIHINFVERLVRCE